MDNMKSTITERGDYWHPDPEKDKKLGGPGANQRAREDRAAASKPKSDPKKRKSGESYMDYAKRHGYKKSTPKKKSLLGRLGLRKEAYRVLAKDKGEKGKPSQFSYKDEKDANKFADSIKSEGGKATVAKEEVVDEATRFKKEQGYQKGGTKKPSGKKDAALSYVLDKIKKEGGVVIGQGSRQQKKVKGAKSDAGTGKYKRAADEKKQTASDAKEMGYGDNVKGYIETKARYGSKENMKSGRGLGT